MRFSFSHLVFVVCSFIARGHCLDIPDEYLNTETAIFNFGGTPETQFSRFPTCQTGQAQSPIDIRQPITPDPNTNLIISDTWNIKRNQEILVNAGHKPQFVDLPSAPKKCLSFKSKTYQYAFRSYHFGIDNSEGSLHTLFGKRYPLEIHTNLFNVEYGSFSNGTNFPDGTMTMAELYQIGEARPTLEPLLNNLKNVIYPNQTAIINTGTTLSSLVPIRSNFYFYQGSATDPKCPEAVTWIVYDTIQTLSDDQMSRFRNVSRDRRGELVIKNWRFLQPRNDRNIGYHSNAVISTYYDVMGLLG